MSAARSPDQEEADEVFFKHRALRALLQLGDLGVIRTMLSFFLFLGDYSENLIPDAGIYTFFQIYFGLSEIPESNECEINSVSHCHLLYMCN